MGKLPAGRLIALAVCVCFVAACALSAAFALSHAGHTHDHDGPAASCAVCAHMAAAETLLKTLFAAAAGAALASGGLFACLSTLKPADFRAGGSTLVLLKAKLNN